MADAAVSMALETLGTLLVDEAKFIFSVSHEVEEVQRELKIMHCFLKDVDRYDSDTVRHLVAELKDLAYGAEDILEKYDIKITSKRHGKGFRNKVKRYSHILSEFVSVHQFGKEIVAIRSRMANLTQRLEAVVKAQSITSSSTYNDQQQQWLIRQTYAHQVEKHFVGMEDNIEQLVSLVMDGGSYRVISICGMGGLGKTTLARKIYQHEDVKGCFEACAWVCITQQFQFKTILQQILKQLLLPETMEETIMRMDERDLVVELHQVQLQKKCLVVIDDIWQIGHWDILSAAFPVAEASCKVLLTTRNEKIAAEECVYRLQFLTEDQGWELLRKIALPEDYIQVVPTESQEIEKVGREVIHKCGCLPLAISVIGGVLRNKQSLGEWKKVIANFDTFVQYGEGIEKERRVAQVLDLSYGVLPYYLKPCFLYLRCYAEDEEIEAEKLFLQWIAEGMIHNETQGREETLTDVAERYLNELASRCLVQVKPIEFPSMCRRVESCRLHDLIRDLCLTKAKEEGFLESMDIYPGSYDSLIVNTRRLALHFHRDVTDELDGPENHANLRCLLLMNDKLQGWYDDSPSYYNFISNLEKFSSLKILVISNCLLGNGYTKTLLPSGIGNRLIHLKYLGIRDCILDELPSSVGNLQRLQTLELILQRWTKIPNVFYKMKRLKHLFLNFESGPHQEQEKIRIDGLNELETFEVFKAKYFDITDFINLKNLRHFKAVIDDIQTLSAIVDYISSVQNSLRETVISIINCDLGSEEGSIILRKMLASPSLCRVTVNGRIAKLPSCDTYQLCPSLVDLKLTASEIQDDQMEVLERLPMLKKLVLDNAFVGCKLSWHASGFPQLMHLSLVDLPNLKEWIVERGAAPKLSSLEIYKCKKLEMIPDGLRFITTLQKLEIICMPQEFVDRLQNVDDQQGQDYDKISSAKVSIFHLGVCSISSSKLMVAQGAAPKLLFLYIQQCRNLEKIPDDLRFINTLQKLGIVSMPPQFVTTKVRQVLL